MGCCGHESEKSESCSTKKGCCGMKKVMMIGVVIALVFVLGRFVFHWF